MPRTTTPRNHHRAALAMIVVITGALVAACTPASPPVAISGTLSIQGAALAVNRLDVTLDITASPGVTEMRVANGPSPSSAAWRPLTSSLAWTLEGPDGTQTVSVEFRAATQTSSIYSDTIVLDRTAPDLAITSVTDGQSLDLRNGEPFLFAGTSGDSGSGVAGVTMSAVGTTQSEPAQLRPDGTWAHPAAADSNGTFSYVATAVDVAGNTTVRQVTLHVQVPDPTQTLKRPGVRTLGPAEQAAVRVVDSAGSHLEFHGDLRSFLAGGTVIVSEHFALAPQGLLRRILDVTYDAATDTTTVSSALGQLFDVFSQLQFSTPAPSPAEAQARAHASATAQTASELCTQFAAGKSVGLSKGLEPQSGTHEIGPTTASFHAGLAAAVYADFDFDVHMYMFGIDVKRAKAEMGIKVCADAGMNLSLRLEDAVRLAGGDWSAGMPKSLLDDMHLESLGVSDFGFHPPKLNTIETQPIVISGVELRGVIGVAIGPVVELPVETNLEGVAGASFVGGVDYHGGIPDLTSEPHLDLQVHQISAVTDARIGFGIDVTAGVNIAEIVTADLFTVTIEPTVHVEAHWANNWVGASSYVNRIDTKLCVDIAGKIGLTLSAEIAHWSFTILDVKPTPIAELSPCYHLDPLIFGGPLLISTATLPDAHTGIDYHADLTTTSSPVHWSVESGILPSGLMLDATTGAITGRATTPGTYPLTIRVTEDGGRTASRIFQIVVSGDPITVTTGWDGSLGLDPLWTCPPWVKLGLGGVMVDNMLHFESEFGSDTNAYIQTGTTLALPPTWIIEANLRVNQSVSGFPQRTGAGIWFSTGAGVGNALQLGEGEIFLAAGNMTKGASASVDTAGFHTYRIEVTAASGAVNVYQDGNLVLSGDVFTSTEFNGTAPRIEFGDGSALATGSSDWHFVRHNAIPPCQV